MTGAFKGWQKKTTNKLTSKLFLANKKQSKGTFSWVYPPLHWPVPVLSSISQHPLLVMYTSWLLAPFLTYIQIPAVLKEMSDLASAATWECETSDVAGPRGPVFSARGEGVISELSSKKAKRGVIKKDGEKRREPGILAGAAAWKQHTPVAVI